MMLYNVGLADKQTLPHYYNIAVHYGWTNIPIQSVSILHRLDVTQHILGLMTSYADELLTLHT